jgi:DNA replication protein DnaC
MREPVTPLGIVQAQIAKWESAGKIPQSRLDVMGSELFSSQMRRAVAAYAEQRKAEAEDPALSTSRAARMKHLEAEEVQAFNANAAERFHAETPTALGDMGLEPQEINALADFQQWPAVLEVAIWRASPGLFLTMGGKPGTGKTVGAASALLGCAETLRTTSGRVMPRWLRSGMFLKAQELARLQTYGPEADAAWERLRIRQLLIIDDLGTEAVTEHWLANLADLIDARMRREVRTIITTNLDSRTFGERYGPRVMRRLRDCGRFFKAEKPATGNVDERRFEPVRAA